MFLQLLLGDRIRSATLSLDGLLDYDESDKDEATFELSLFAESFQDMLTRDYGQIIFEALQAFRSALPKPLKSARHGYIRPHCKVCHLDQIPHVCGSLRRRGSFDAS